MQARRVGEEQGAVVGDVSTERTAVGRPVADLQGPGGDRRAARVGIVAAGQRQFAGADLDQAQGAVGVVGNRAVEGARGGIAHREGGGQARIAVGKRAVACQRGHLLVRAAKVQRRAGRDGQGRGHGQDVVAAADERISHHDVQVLHRVSRRVMGERPVRVAARAVPDPQVGIVGVAPVVVGQQHLPGAVVGDLHGAIAGARAGPAVAEIVSAAIGAGNAVVVALTVVARPELDVAGCDAGSGHDTRHVRVDVHVPHLAVAAAAGIVMVELAGSRGRHAQHVGAGGKRVCVEGRVNVLQGTAVGLQFEVIPHATERSVGDAACIIHRVGHTARIQVPRIGNAERIDEFITPRFRDVRKDALRSGQCGQTLQLERAAANDGGTAVAVAAGGEHQGAGALLDQPAAAGETAGKHGRIAHVKGSPAAQGDGLAVGGGRAADLQHGPVDRQVAAGPQLRRKLTASVPPPTVVPPP